jgi:hypothetical protein
VAEALAGAVEVAPLVLARADEVADLLLDHGGHADEGQLAGDKQSGQPLGVAAVGLHPVGGLPRDQPRGADAPVEVALGGRPREGKARRPGLIDGADFGREPLEEGDDDPRRLAAQAAAVELASGGIEDSRVSLVGVDVEAHERRNLHLCRHLP